MSDFTRAQIRVLMKRANDLIQQSHDIRRELEAVMARIEKAGFAAEFTDHEKIAPKRKSST